MVDRYAIVLVNRETGDSSTACVVMDKDTAHEVATDAEDDTFLCRYIPISERHTTDAN